MSSTSIHILATLWRDRYTATASKERGEPIKRPIEKRHCFSNKKSERFGKEIHTGILDDSISGRNLGLHLKTLIEKPSMNQIFLSQIHMESASCWRWISMCFGSRRPKENFPLSPSFEKISLPRSMEGRPCENFPTSAKWNGFESISTRVWGIFRLAFPRARKKEVIQFLAVERDYKTEMQRFWRLHVGGLLAYQPPQNGTGLP